MRIISGTAKGQPIKAPKGQNTRPVTDKIRESLFDIWQFGLPGSSFLDLYAGSGSMGLEALSRGASQVVFVEKDRNANACIAENLNRINVDQSKARQLKKNVFAVLEEFGKKGERFDYVYADPPFTRPQDYAPLLELLDKSQIVEDDGFLILRAPTELVLPEQLVHYRCSRKKVYGISQVWFYEPIRKKDEH